MKKEELAQYGYLRAEVAQLELRLERLRRTGAPEELRLALLHQRARCYRELLRLERFFSSVEDSRMRLILSLRYAENLSWKQVAFAIGEHDEQVPRRLHNRFLKSTEKRRGG